MKTNHIKAFFLFCFAWIFILGFMGFILSGFNLVITLQMAMLGLSIAIAMVIVRFLVLTIYDLMDF